MASEHTHEEETWLPGSALREPAASPGCSLRLQVRGANLYCVPPLNSGGLIC